jgi:hypothetical protein
MLPLPSTQRICRPEQSRPTKIRDADVARRCIQEGLIDEIRVHLAPALLNDGVRLFNWPGRSRPGSFGDD